MAENFPTPIGQPCVVWRNKLQGFSRKVEKCWQNGGGDGGGRENGPKTISTPFTQGDLISGSLSPKILITFPIWANDVKCSHIFMFSEQIKNHHVKGWDLPHDCLPVLFSVSLSQRRDIGVQWTYFVPKIVGIHVDMNTTWTHQNKYSPKYLQETTHISDKKTMYGVSSVSSKSEEALHLLFQCYSCNIEYVTMGATYAMNDTQHWMSSKLCWNRGKDLTLRVLWQFTSCCLFWISSFAQKWQSHWNLQKLQHNIHNS